MTAAQAQPAAEIPVERVILFTSGVGYFEHSGRVSGDADVTLRFGETALNDVLKSLLVEDAGGRVAGVVYPSQAPVERTLRSFAIDLSDGPDMPSILRQVRGAVVVVSTPGGTVRGTVVSVDRQSRESGGAAIAVDVLSLLTENGLQAVRLDTASRIAFADPALEAELEGALAALAEARGGDRKPVRIQFRGSGSRSVRMGYVTEAPVWKTSYRLVLPSRDESQAALQGWALVENPTEADWTSVDLTLVSGRPVSFVTDLYTPRYIQRPFVVLEDDAVVRPENYAAGSSNDAAEVSSAMMARSARAAAAPAAPPPPPPPAPQPIDPTSSVVAQGTQGDFGELFAYRLGEVTLPRQGAAMLPIVGESVRAERLSVFSGAAGRHPMRGVRLTNTTSASLRGGPMTVLDDGYAGDALLPDLSAGDERLITFAVDQDILVDPFQPADAAGTIETATLRDGVLVIQRQGRSARGYRVENRDSKARTVLIEHVRRQDAQLITPSAPEETTPDRYRFRVEVEAGTVDSLEVVESRVVSERIALATASPDQIAAYAAASGAIPDDVREALRRAIADRRALADTEQQINTLRRELSEIENEQTRIRGNLEAVDNTSDYGRRLLDKLNEQESRIETIREQLDDLEAEATRQRAALRVSIGR